MCASYTQRRLPSPAPTLSRSGSVKVKTLSPLSSLILTDLKYIMVNHAHQTAVSV